MVRITQLQLALAMLGTIVRLDHHPLRKMKLRLAITQLMDHLLKSNACQALTQVLQEHQVVLIAKQAITAMSWV